MQEFYDDILLYGRLTIDIVDDGEGVNQVVLSSDGGVLNVNGNPVLTTQSANNTIVKTSNYILTIDDHIILASGAITITLPTASVIYAKHVFTIKRISAGTVVVDSLGGLIDGMSEFSLTENYESINVCTDGTHWYII